MSAFEVVQHAGPITAKTWVRTDGVILRQEVPFPVRAAGARPPARTASPRLETKEPAR